jgi:hypothetical protein
MGLMVESEPEAIEVETCIYDRSTEVYLPDFYVSGGQEHFKGCYVEIKPWLPSDVKYKQHDLESVQKAVCLGYEVPTLIVVGSPRAFFGVCCNERHEGSPEGYRLGWYLQALGPWCECGWCPDEGDELKDPREFTVDCVLRGEVWCRLKASEVPEQIPFHEQVEIDVQWKGRELGPISAG